MKIQKEIISRILYKSNYCHALLCPPSDYLALYHSRLGTVLKASQKVKSLLEKFSTPTLVADVVRAYDDKEGTLSAINLLLKKHFLTSFGEPQSSDNLFLEELIKQRKKHIKKNHLIRNLRLNVSLNCNYSCDYCSQSFISPQRRTTNSTSKNKKIYENDLMSWDVAHEAIDNFFIISSGRPNLTVRFFGGEPFINWSLIVKAITYIQKNYHDEDILFFINTNGSFINNGKASFLFKNKVNTLVSLDGLLNANKHRKTLSKNETYSKTIKAIDCLKQHKVSVGLLAVITNQTKKELEELVIFAEEKEIKNIDAGEVRFAARFSDWEQNVDELVEKLLYIRRFAKSRGIEFGGFWSILRTAKEGLDFCGGVGRELCVNPDGSIFPCYGLPLHLGTVGSIKQIPQSKTYRNLSMRVVGNITECEGCDVEIFCAGQCPADVFYKTKDYNLIPKEKCEFWRAILKGIIKDLIVDSSS